MAKKLDATGIIKKHKGKVVRTYSLISNWGYVVSHNGGEYDVRRWANCYGSDCGWGVMFMKGTPDKEWADALDKDLNNVDLNTEW